jgi:hypothetical protein
LLKLNSNTAGLPSVAAAAIVATVGAASLSIVPVAEAVPDNSKGLIDSAIVSAVVGTETVPVVAPAGTVTVCEVVV